MIIQHFCNSFISISSGNQLILCDPWLGLANHGGWHSFPFLNAVEVVAKLDEPDLIYISHLHTDHFSPATLKTLASSRSTFLIKNFSSKKLKNSISQLGFNKIIELDAFNPTVIGNFEFTIVPQFETNTDDLFDEVSYDLDTSLIIKEISSNKVFFNAVDNPLSLNSLKEVRNFVETKLNSSIDVACLASGAASEYPQCFPEIDRRAICDNYSLTSARRYIESIQVLGAETSFLAGGRYAISGRFCPLNQFLAQPSHSLIVETHKELQSFTNLSSYYIDGGGSINVGSKDLEIIPKEFVYWVNEFENRLLNFQYEYENFGTHKENICAINELFPLARQNLESSLKSKGFKSFAHISFKIHKQIFLNQLTPVLDQPCASFDLDPIGESKNSIEIHLESGALRGILDGRLVLNQVLSGSLAFQIRRPEEFDASSVFALNYFHT